VYAVFTTPRNSIGGNAICAFRIRDLMDTFEGAFKEQETANSNWLPVPKIKEPNPRPGEVLNHKFFSMRITDTVPRIY
jgi:semaphorin 6